MTISGWVVRVEHRYGWCAATTLGGEACGRHGLYGWNGAGYCYQHQPDYPAWSREHDRIQKIAQAAVDSSGPMIPRCTGYPPTVDNSTIPRGRGEVSVSGR